MRSWDLKSLELEPHAPKVLTSGEEGRAVALTLSAGDALDEHQVHERAWVTVIDGEVELTSPAGESVSGGAGLLAEFDPAERHTLRARSDSRVLLLLTPWPGDGHPSKRD